MRNVQSKQKSSRDQSKRWFNKELRILKQQRRKYERSYVKYPSTENLELYKSAKNKYTWSLKTTRINYFKTSIETSKKESRNLFNCLKYLTGTNNERVLPSRVTDEIIAEEFSNYTVLHR